MPTSADQSPKNATEHTRALNLSVKVDLEAADFDRAQRGFIAAIPDGRVTTSNGQRVSDISDYAFLSDMAPDTVNPSLWRHAQLNAHHGLFQVAENVWQVRGYDISNITFIKGDIGWIVIDPLTVEHTARAAYDLISQHIEPRPVTGVIYTHSHADHFGGVHGVTTLEDVAAGRCRIIAPVGFLHETIGENVIAGHAMGRRATYQFGSLLPPNPKGHVDCGLGNSVPTGAPGLIAPTQDINETGEELLIDGVRIIFQLTPETEAPAEMNFFFPDYGWMCMAENCSHTMHNLVPIRGALVRNALRWSKYINESMELFGRNIQVLFTSHNWPRWGNEDILGFLTLQRDLYKWMHDQTMRHANHGLNPLEIAELLELPEDFQAQDHTRGFYGDLIHNSKAVYQRYLSWYDGNPANLNKLPPRDVGSRYVDLAGGPDALLAAAQKSFAAGDYRWVVELVNHLVFSDPTNLQARHMQADALEQLGYQAESSTFRNAYLMGAQELRYGAPAANASGLRGRGILNAMTIDQIFDVLGVRLISENVGGLCGSVNWTFTDMAGTTDEKWVLGLSHRTLFSVPGRHDPAATASLIMKRSTLISIIAQEATFADEIGKGNIVQDGDLTPLINIFGNLDTFQTFFNIVEP